MRLFYALRRYRSERGAEPRQVSGGRRVQFRVGAVLTAFAAVLFVLGIVFTDKARETPASGADGLQVAHSEPLQIQATGQQWLWRYDYPNEAFSYYKLVVPVDTTVSLDLVSTDVIHTWFVPDLAGKRDAVPGKHNRSSSAPTRKAPSTATRRPSRARPTRRCGPRSKSSRRRNTKTSSRPRKPTSRPPRTGSSA